jgi:plastocyanin
MSSQPSKLARRVARSACALLAALAVSTAHAEFVRVTATNAVGNSVYDVTSFAPPAGTTVPLNSDGASHGSFVAVIQVANLSAGTVDVLVADATKGQIIRYTPQVGATPASETVVWTYSGTGPAHPDGLALDAANNLYIVTNKKPSLWVLPVSSSSSTGYAANPLLIDSSSFFALGDVTLRDSAVATTTTAAWGVGDLLVLTGSKNNANTAELTVYRAASIASVLGGGGARTAPDLILIGPSQFPSGEYPVGFDFWPQDLLVSHPTLLVATTAGRVLRYDFTAGSGGVVPGLVQVFASGLGAGLGKLKVGLQLETPYAFVTQTTSNAILALGAPLTPGTTNLFGTATQGVNNPQGLAVARQAAISAAQCVAPQTCDLSGGVIPHSIVTAGQSVSGNVIEGTCVVLKDPRVTVDPVHGNSCDGTTLNVATLCPGFGNEIIPGSMCGASGFSTAGFALVRTVASGVDNVPGIFVLSQQDANKILPPTPPATNPSCTATVLGWAPRSDAVPSEGGIVEVDAATGLFDLIDITGLCDGSGGGSRGLSVYGVGFAINSSAFGGDFHAYTLTKYNNLFTTVDTANITQPTKASLESALGQVNTYLTQSPPDYACAAYEVVKIDTSPLVGLDPTPALDYPGSAPNPNPWGEVRGRLANLYYTINTRILNNPPNITWPITLAEAPPCGAPVVTLTATPPVIEQGSSSTITWNGKDATYCQASYGDSGWGGPNNTVRTVAASGSYPTPALTGSQSYALDCFGAGGATTGTVRTVTVLPPLSIQSFGASPSSITQGDAVPLSWMAPNAYSCTVTGPSVNVTVPGAQGGVSVSPGTTATYTLTCSDQLAGTPAATSASTTSKTATVTVVPPPTIQSFGASLTSITAGDPVTLSWTSQNTASCSIYDGTATISGPTGTSVPVSPAATTTYTLSCGNSLAGSGGSTLATTTFGTTVTVTVVPMPTIQSFGASLTSITAGDPVTLSWTSSNTASCSIYDGTATTSGITPKSLTVSPAATTTYTLSCGNSLAGSGGSALATTTFGTPVTVTVYLPPKIGSFSASPATITTGGTSTLSWSAVNATSCAVTGPGVSTGPLGVNSTYTVTPSTGTSTYTLTCGNAVAGTPGASTAATMTVTTQVTALAPPTISSFSPNPSYTDGDELITLNWSASNVTSCAIKGGTVNLMGLAATGSRNIGYVKATTAYTLTCSNSANGSASRTTTVTFRHE